MVVAVKKTKQTNKKKKEIKPARRENESFWGTSLVIQGMLLKFPLT